MCRTEFADPDVERSKQLCSFLLDRRGLSAPEWTEDWISPIDAQFAAATFAMNESDSHLLLIDVGDGSVATAVGHYLAAYCPTAQFEVASSRISQRSLSSLAKLDGCIGVFPETAIRTRSYGPNSGVVGRFETTVHALSTFSAAIELFGSFGVGQLFLIHEVWRGHRYPFQYHFQEALPNLAHVVEILCQLGYLEHVGHSAFLAEYKPQELEHLNFGSPNRNFIMSAYRRVGHESK